MQNNNLNSQQASQTDISDAFVFFGATGDLAYKQIFPAILQLVQKGQLDVPIIGVAKSGWDLAKLKERARASIEASVKGSKDSKFDQASFDKMASQLHYIDGDYSDSATFSELKKVLGQAKRPLYYLCIPPVLFEGVVDNLQKSGCLADARVVAEKPFGHDLKSAQELNEILAKHFKEENIFRIDHYLGKEPVQNLVYFRFANPIVEACWNNDHIDSVQITMAEQFGVTGRGKLYDEEGALRDVVQNHLIEVIANLAMECPCGPSSEARRDVRGDLLKSLRALTPADVVRGQFKGYLDEPGVAPDSKVETFAAVRFFIDNERWQDVPFYVRTGKCLPVTATEAIVRFKHLPHPVLDETCLAGDTYYRFQLSPQQVIALGLKIKAPGEAMKGSTSELITHQEKANEMPPYVRLLGDAMRGDSTLFAREDSVEASWRALDPILGKEIDLQIYEPGSWGPDLKGVLEPPGGWQNPSAT